MTTLEPVEHLRLALSVAGLNVAELALPSDRHFTRGPLRLHYLDWGRGGSPPILFLHGGCVTAHTWDLVCIALRSDCHCLALDQRGHGDSAWSLEGDYSLPAHVRDIAAWVEHLGFERFILVGHSLGALNALGYALQHGERLAALVTVDIGLRFPSTSGARRIVDFVTLPPEAESIEAFVERAVAFNPLRHPHLLRRSLLHNLRRLPGGRWTWKYDRALLDAPLQRLPASFEAVRSGIPGIRCPVLVVHGALSDVIAIDDAAELARALPDGRLVQVDGAGHTVQGDNPRGFVDALRAFLSDVYPLAPRKESK